MREADATECDEGEELYTEELFDLTAGDVSELVVSPLSTWNLFAVGRDQAGLTISPLLLNDGWFAWLPSDTRSSNVLRRRTRCTDCWRCVLLLAPA